MVKGLLMHNAAYKEWWMDKRKEIAVVFESLLKLSDCT